MGHVKVHSHSPNANVKLFTTGLSLFSMRATTHLCSTYPYNNQVVLHSSHDIWQQPPPQMELNEFISVKQCSDQAKANAKAKSFFDVCHLLFDVFRFRTLVLTRCERALTYPDGTWRLPNLRPLLRVWSRTDTGAAPAVYDKRTPRRWDVLWKRYNQLPNGGNKTSRGKASFTRTVNVSIFASRQLWSF